MSKNGRKNISFSEADHAKIVEAAREHGYNVSAGAGSQLGEFVLDCVTGRCDVKDEQPDGDPTN